MNDQFLWVLLKCLLRLLLSEYDLSHCVHWWRMFWWILALWQLSWFCVENDLASQVWQENGFNCSWTIRTCLIILDFTGKDLLHPAIWQLKGLRFKCMAFVWSTNSRLRPNRCPQVPQTILGFFLVDCWLTPIAMIGKF